MNCIKCFVFKAEIGTCLLRGTDWVFKIYLYNNNNNNNLDWGPVPRFAPWKHCSDCGLLYDSPFSKRSYLGRQVPLASTTRGSPLAARGGTMGEKWWPNGALGYAPRVLLHAANLRHGTDNFTSLPKVGVLRIFIAL